MEENKVKGFVKKHKKAFIVSGIVLTGAIGGIIFKKNMSGMKAGFDLDKIDLDELGLLGKVVKVEKASKAVSWFEDDSVEIADIKYTVSDLGKLVKAYWKSMVISLNPRTKFPDFWSTQSK